MQRHIILYIGVFLTAMLFGCSRPSDSEDQVETITVDLAEARYDSDDFFDGWSYVVLQTSNGKDEGLIGSIMHIAIDDSNIVVQSRENEYILVYSRDGSLITKFNRKGQGPHEYIDTETIKLIDGNIWVVCPSPKLLVYDKTGEFIRSFKLPNHYHDFKFIDNDKVIFDSDYRSSIGYNFVVYDFEKEEVVGKMLPFGKNTGMGRGSFSTSFIGNGTDKIYLSQIFDHNVYELTSDSTVAVSHRFEFKSGFDISDDDLANKSKVELYDMTAGKDFVKWFGPSYYVDDIYYQVLSATHDYIYKRDTATGKEALMKIGENIHPDFPFLSRARLIYDGNYVSYLEPFIITEIEKIIKKNIITDSIDLNEDSNQVIFFHHFKH